MSRRLRAMVEAGRVEILGGGFYEPILTMIPRRDRIGQVRDYAAYLEGDTSGRPSAGAWLAERVWEQHLALDLAEAGVEYIFLDDFHFHRAGLSDDELLGYYLTEDHGRLLKVFPGAERLRYLMPYQEPHESYVYLRQIAEQRPGSTVVFADDGEKFGVWPESHDHVFVHGWLRRFCDMLAASREWLHVDDLRQGGRLDAAAGQGLPARLVVPRDDRVGPADAEARRLQGRLRPARPPPGGRRPAAVRPRRRGLAELQGAVRRDRRDVFADARRSPTASPP